MVSDAAVHFIIITSTRGSRLF